MENTGVTLKIVTPGGEGTALCCDSVQLCIQEGQDDRNGGWIGIRRGHTDALMALREGTVKALREGAVISEMNISGGVAFVENNVVTVLTSEITG